MRMNIKDPEVHAMARQLAARQGTSVTDAVRQALSAELERLPNAMSEASVEARKEAVRAICRRTSAIPPGRGSAAMSYRMPSTTRTVCRFDPHAGC